MIVLDSSVLIPLLQGDAEVLKVVAAWRAEGEELATTSINVAEVLRGEGFSARRLQRARIKLRGLTEIPFGPRAAARFASFMQGLDRACRPAPVLDALIASATLEAGARLATRDARGFAHIPSLEILEF